MEATRDRDDEKNFLSLPVVYTGRVDDLMTFTGAYLHSAARRQAQPDIAAWSSSTRLNPARGLDERRHQPQVLAELAHLDQWLEPAMNNLKNHVDFPASTVLCGDR